MTTSESGGQAARGQRRASDDEPVLPSITRDESAEGWGDERGDSGSGGERDEAWYRRERPPHHE